MNNIIIQAHVNHKLSKKQVDIGNMQENKVTKLIFELDEDIALLGGNVYLFVSYDDDTHPYPLTDNSVVIGRELTQRSKTYANLVVSTSDNPDDLLQGAVWISDTIILTSGKNNINIDSINEQELPPSLQIVYDRLLNLEKDLQEKRDSDYWRGANGKDGTDATVTSSNITKALGYTPASQEKVDNLSEEIAELDNLTMTQIKEVVEIGTNIFNPNLVVFDKKVSDNSTGEIIDTTNGDFMSQTFEVKDGESAITISYVTGSGTHQLLSIVATFYDAGMNFIQQASATTHNIPTNAKYFILNIGNIFASAISRIMVQYGDTMTTFEPYTETVREEESLCIKNECLEFADIVVSKNKYNYKTRTDDVSMNTDGNTISNTTRSVSDFIDCYGESVFSASNGAEGTYCFYDKNKTFISPFGVFSNGKENIAIPSNAHYLRVSFAKKYAKTFTISFTEEAIPYEAYDTSYVAIKSDLDKKSCKSIISEVLASGGTIKLLGDSITHGVGGTGFAQDGVIIPVASGDTSEFKVNESGYCWANIFKNYIAEKYGNSVLNFGTRGIRSYDIVNRLEADNGYVTSDDELLIVMIGTNNKWATTSDTLKDLKNDIQWIVDWCAENNKKIILVSAPMSTIEMDTQYTDGTEVKFHNEDIDHIYKEVCYKNNMVYIPMYQRMVEYCDLKDIDISTIFDDGLHPNDKGYYIMYKLFMKELGLAYQMPSSTWDDASPVTS